MIATRFLIYCCSVAWLLFEGAAFAGAADTAASGKVVGMVSVAGVAGRPKPLPVFKSRSFCGATVVNETLLIGADGRLRNAAVILRPLSGGMVAQPKKLVLDNQRCAFAPHVQVAPLGSELLLKNSDPILHTVHARLGRETLFNVGLPKWRVVTKRLDRAGVIRIDCDVLHTWMSAAIIVTGWTSSCSSLSGRLRLAMGGTRCQTYKATRSHDLTCIVVRTSTSLLGPNNQRIPSWCSSLPDRL
jgi:hypothetical protein